MNILRSQLSEQADILRFFKSLPVDVKVMIQTYYKSHKPNSICPMCQRLHYPMFCYHYCRVECYARALKNMVWFHSASYDSDESP